MWQQQVPCSTSMRHRRRLRHNVLGSAASRLFVADFAAAAAALVVLCLACLSLMASRRRLMLSVEQHTNLERHDERLRQRTVSTQASAQSPFTRQGPSFSATTVDFFANNGYSRALRTAAIMGEFAECVNTTFMVYQGSHEDPYAIAYDHHLHKWLGPIRVGTSPLGKIPDPVLPLLRPFVDDGNRHRNAPRTPYPGNNRGPPTVVIDSMGYLHVSFGGGGGDESLARSIMNSYKKRLGNHSIERPDASSREDEEFRGDFGSGRQTHARSRRPYDIREWTTVVRKGRRTSSKDEEADTTRSSLSPLGSECQFVKVPRMTSLSSSEPQSSDPELEPSGSPIIASNDRSSALAAAQVVDLYHFCRHGYQAADITMQRSDDDGATWTLPLPIFRTLQRRISAGLAALHHERSDTYSNRTSSSRLVQDGWSCRFRAGVGTAAHIIGGLCTYRRHTTVPREKAPSAAEPPVARSALPRLSNPSAGRIGPSSYNLYYLELDARTQQWRNVRGQVLNDKLPLTKEDADDCVRALETEQPPTPNLRGGELDGSSNLIPGTKNVRPVSVALARPGYPHLLFQAPAGAVISSSSVAQGRKLRSARRRSRSGAKKLLHMGWTGHTWTEPVPITGQTSTSESDSRENDDDDDNDNNPHQEDGDEDGDITAHPVNGMYGSPPSREILSVTLSLSNRTHSLVRTLTSLDHGASWVKAGTGSHGDRGYDDGRDAHERVWMAIRRHHGRLIPSSYVLGGRMGARTLLAYLEEPAAVSRRDSASIATPAAVPVYRKLYLIGPDGPIPRARAEAEVCRGVVMSGGDGSICAPLS